MNSTKSYVSTKHFATTFGVSPVAVRTWIAAGAIKAVRLGRKYFIPVGELERIATEGIRVPGRDDPLDAEGGSHVPG